MFAVRVEEHDGTHRVQVLEPAAADWLERLAAEYRALRTATAVPLDLLKGLEMDVAQIRKRLVEVSVPTRTTSTLPQLAVERSDFGELAMAVAGVQFQAYVYGYRSIRDRELVHLPGRGIDQIGVREVIEDGRSVVYLSLGEAKVSSQAASPPGVVATGTDSLHVQHTDHITDRAVTSGKLWEAARKTVDPAAARLMFSAAWLWDEDEDGRLIVRCTSMLVRPSHGAIADAGPFRTAPSDYEPGEVDFMVLRVDTDDIEALVDDFLTAARTRPEDAA